MTTVTWTATDESGNSAFDTQSVTVRDTTPPVIVLMGDASIVLECGAGDFIDPGASVQDNADPNVSVVIGGDTVDTTTPATYVITYDAEDASGNAANRVTRTIVVSDTMAPSISPQASDLLVECDGSGNAAEIGNWLESNGGAAAVDACGPVTWRHDFGGLTGGCQEALAVTFTATDTSGNSATTSASIKVIDTTAPDVTFVRKGEILDGELEVPPSEFPIQIEIDASDLCGSVASVISVTSHRTSKKGKTKDTTNEGDHDVIGNTVKISRSGGVGNVFTVAVTATDQCGNTIDSKQIIRVVKKPAANEGLGNGVDGDTPGHEHNGGNDDPGTGPGNPGAKEKKK